VMRLAGGVQVLGFVRHQELALRVIHRRRPAA
jgi:hypothetical protein